MNSGLSTCFLVCLEHSKGISYIVKKLPAKADSLIKFVLSIYIAQDDKPGYVVALPVTSEAVVSYTAIPPLLHIASP